MSKLQCVPANTITGKDLDYLSDMFQWNYNAFKKTTNDIELLRDQKLVDVFSDACNMFDGKFNIMGNYKPTYPVIFRDDTYDALILPIHISSDSNTVNYIRGL